MGTRSVTYRHYKVTREVLSPAECSELIRFFEASDWEEYKTAPMATALGLGVRQNLIDLGHTWDGLADTIIDLFQEVNDAIWKFDIDAHLHQPLRVAKYLPGFFHDWHTDFNRNDPSKLAISIPLNDSYTGGKFQLLQTPPINVRPGRGVMFPAYHGHRVTKIESGERYVLLAWISGPRFK